MAISITSRGWTRLGEHVYARRYDSYDLTIGVVAGDDGLLVIDSRASVAEGIALRDDIRQISALPVAGVVNTHQHFDHTLGNAAFDSVSVIGHESLATSTDPHRPGTRVPDVTFASAWSTDLGGCLVELIHPGPAHTAGDIVVKVVPDRLVFAGDLVEESGPPSYGSDSYPLDWGEALDLVVGITEPDATIVPGHGDAVDRDFVQDQRQTILDIANQIRSCADAGMSVADALAGDWPLDPAYLEDAVRRGFEQLSGPAA